MGLCLCFSGAYASDFQPARTAGLGGAGRAGPLMNDGIYLNPAFLAFLKSYTFSGQYEWHKGPNNGRILHASIQDGSSEFFAAGFGYTVRQDAKLAHVSLGKALTPTLAVGLGGKAYIAGDVQSALFDVIGSVSYIHSALLQFALVVDNILETDSKRSRGLVREFAIGSRVNIDNILVIFVDPHWAPAISEKYGVEIGLEFKLFNDLSLKLGHFRGSQIPFLNSRGKGYSTGAGWVGPRMSIDVALTRVIEPVGTTAGTAGFTVFF